MGSELVPIGERSLAAAQTEETRVQLAGLVERGDTQTLSEIAARAEAIEKYQKRQGHLEVANHAARLKIECEAGIGVIDLKLNPWSRNVKRSEFPLPVSVSMRSIWRKLGIAQMLGALDGVLDKMSTDIDAEINTASVHARLITEGVGWVDPGPLIAATRKAVRTQDISLEEVCRRAGVSKDMLVRRRFSGGMGAQTAMRVASIIDFDITQLRPLPPRRPRRKKRSMRRIREVRGDWAHAYQQIRLVQGEVDKLDGAAGNAELWAALHIVEDLVVARSRGRRSLNAHHAQQIRQALCAVVGSDTCVVLKIKEEGQ